MGVKLKKLIIVSLFFIPFIAFADVNNITDLISQLQGIINALIPLLFGIALIGFIVGVIRYIWAAGNPAKIKEARAFIVFSIIAIAIMLSVWSLALFVKDSFFPSAPAGINFNGNSVGVGTGSGINNNPQGGSGTSANNNDCTQDMSDGEGCNNGAGTCQSGVCNPTNTNPSGTGSGTGNNSNPFGSNSTDCTQSGTDGQSCNGGAGTCQAGSCVNTPANPQGGSGTTSSCQYLAVSMGSVTCVALSSCTTGICIQNPSCQYFGSYGFTASSHVTSGNATITLGQQPTCFSSISECQNQPDNGPSVMQCYTNPNPSGS